MESYLVITTPIILALFAGVGWLYKHEKERRVQIEKQLSEKKYQVYIKFINLYFQLYENVKSNKKMPHSEMSKIMIEIKKELMMYGSDSVVKKFFIWQQFSKDNKTNVSLIPITSIIIEMRKDMGMPKSKITTTDFLKSIVNSEEEYNSLKNQGVV